MQRSVTGARRLWQLRRARQAFADCAPALAELGSGVEWQRLIALIRRLSPRLEVSKRLLLAAHLRTKARRVGALIGRRGAQRAVYALQTGVGHLVADVPLRRDQEWSLRAATKQQLVAFLQAGDVLVTRKAHALTNRLLPGYWPHAVLYAGRQLPGAAPNQHLRVIEAQRDGVKVRSLDHAVRCNQLCVLRPRLNPDQLREVLACGLQHIGKPYDFAFDFRRSDRMVCSEVIYRSFGRLQAATFDLVPRFGRPTLSPQDLVVAATQPGHLFTLVAAVVADDGELLYGSEAALAVVKTISDT